MDNNQLEKYIGALCNYESNRPFDSQLELQTEGNLEVFFSPFEYVNEQAEIVLVGISPGATQANNANVCARNLIRNGETLEAVSKAAKATGSFSGALRNNLVSLLDHVLINQRLGIRSCDLLFGEYSHLLHSTSVFRYPTLLNGKPISSAKKALKSHLLKDMIDTCLAKECRQLPDSAFYVPMGQGVDEVLLYLCDNGVLRREQVLIGLPHPSGANAERISYFLGKKERERLSDKTNPDKIDAAKYNLLSQLRTA